LSKHGKISAKASVMPALTQFTEKVAPRKLMINAASTAFEPKRTPLQATLES
jgi:hypothetical protein